MDKQAILSRLQNEVDTVINTVENLPEERFFQQPHPEKWSIGQNVLHLINSSKPLVSMFGKPELMNQWAKSNRVSRSYDEVKTLYNNALETPPAFLQIYRHLNTEGSKADMLEVYKSVSAKLLERAALLSEADLDSYQIPHPLPLVGLLTAAEFLHFTAYHTRHHHDIIETILTDFS